ncbi:HAMP domain-containing histidine kinase [Parasporobacterium paucivorans]|uniref:histidine kinase n=1 Tax=Parasporobacterium paucivorans DSM 15970 TaxID=1122934 RepID=A0A1M6CVN7_9FIRM|nr:HAMP domain-containing histidine kinase [Parasporobacterium paucivorans]SHI64953.1 Signal transduction histidine kinase [Parasporobacterium paucivorans DSM 15970]
MNRTLYSNILLAYILFAVCAFLVLFRFTSDRFYLHLVKNEAEIMYDNAYLISSQYDLYDIQSGPEDKRLSAFLSTMSGTLDARIRILDESGTVLVDSKEASPSGTIVSFDTSYFEGNYYRIGTFFDTFKEDVLSVYLPITGNYTTTGYIVLNASLDSVVPEQEYILGQIYISFLIILLLSLVFLVIFYLMVYKPIRKICGALSEYAKGNLSYPPPEIKADNELGMISVSLGLVASELKTLKVEQNKFIANVSHDFRSPLTSIKGYIEAMKDGTIPPEMQEKYLDTVLFETQRLTKLTESILSLNTGEKAGSRLRYQVFDINTIVKHTVEALEGICQKKKITVHLTFEERSYMVWADMEKIQQVVYNLVDNAVKFSNAKSKINISVYDKGEKVFVSVKDNGVGIPKENLNKIWERFFKTDQSRGRDKTGTGLGLAITKEIIQEHNENINVISTKNVGSEFIFTLQKSKKKA